MPGSGMAGRVSWGSVWLRQAGKVRFVEARKVAAGESRLGAIRSGKAGWVSLGEAWCCTARSGRQG